MHYTAFGLLHQNHFFWGGERWQVLPSGLPGSSLKPLLYEFILKKEESKGDLDMQEHFLIMTSRFSLRLVGQEGILTKSQVH